MDDNLKQQQEEISALEAIYASDWRKESEINNCYNIQINSEVQLFITFNDEYPTNKAPLYELLAPSLTREQKNAINKTFDHIYQINQGQPVLFQWIEKLREMVSTDIIEKTEELQINEIDCKNEISSFNIIHGKTIEDRKSIFQGHVCSIQSEFQVKEVMTLLMQNKKIVQAAHNILAYRISTVNGILVQDYDDDGETHAGRRLLHLLQILKVTNVLVIVTRWYGGIHLGPDRFRHINNAARQVLDQAGYLTGS